MGGAIRAESEEGKGSTFTFFIETRQESEPLSKTAPAIVTNAKDFGKAINDGEKKTLPKHILVVE